MVPQQKQKKEEQPLTQLPAEEEDATMDKGLPVIENDRMNNNYRNNVSELLEDFKNEPPLKEKSEKI